MNHKDTTKPEAGEISDLKPEQKKVLAEIYQYSDEGHFSEEDLKLAATMFDKPEKFKLLRKIFGVLTAEERGLTITSPQNLVQADIKDLHGYAIETAVNNLAQEKIKNALFSFYRNLRTYLVAEKKAEFEAANQEEFDEEKRKEGYEEEKRDGEVLGDNL